MSSSFTNPPSIISANPEIEVSGVFSSWETFAENSLLRFSRSTFSVTFIRRSTAPCVSFSRLTGFAMICTSLPSIFRIFSSCFPLSTLLITFWKSSLLLKEYMLSPILEFLTLKSFQALRFPDRIMVYLSIMRRPSCIFSVMMENSSCCCLASSSCSLIILFCLYTRLKRGEISS